MAVEMKEIEVWVMIDAGGDYAVGIDEDTCCERYEEEIGGTVARRMVKVVLNVPLPTTPTLRGTVPVEGEAGLELVGAQ